MTIGHPITPPSVAALIALASATALTLPAPASAHARISPAVWLSNQLQLYSLAVPTEKNNLTTSKIVLRSRAASASIHSFPACRLAHVRR
jgi:uncharacterized protein YcnI